ncbi:hypothetical protein PN36_32515 [Candidatus Thiomargarita nelsonii]|uniref:BsuBI/PstI restriction endonuclease domain-containing protein n=1 Tax=Candidatus Thiomargarita nelsonii TaxID=1003181 RepID=A0A4E0QKW3_9GAMM|nr:hypothetical protein PN36_32515 [Candidatus Thiomargarita nelsonii]
MSINYYSAGKHNLLQKEIIEEFLPRFGQNKRLYLEEKQLKSLNFFELAHDELPDIIAYDSSKKWLYLEFKKWILEIAWDPISQIIKDVQDKSWTPKYRNLS